MCRHACFSINPLTLTILYARVPLHLSFNKLIEIDKFKEPCRCLKLNIYCGMCLLGLSKALHIRACSCEANLMDHKKYLIFFPFLFFFPFFGIYLYNGIELLFEHLEFCPFIVFLNLCPYFNLD